MKISKDIADKIELVNKLNKEIGTYLKENVETEGCLDLKIVDKPKGREQGEGEYCDQVYHGEDWFTGTYYYPIEDSNKYLAMAYEM